MTLEYSADKIMERFEQQIFPEPFEFSNLEINAIAAQAGTDPLGTFDQTPLGQSLIKRYGLEEEFGEHTWPGFAAFLRDARSSYYAGIPEQHKERAISAVTDAIETCLALGLSHEEISDAVNL